jgi:hypothetical protein
MIFRGCQRNRWHSSTAVRGIDLYQRVIRRKKRSSPDITVIVTGFFP